MKTLTSQEQRFICHDDTSLPPPSDPSDSDELAKPEKRRDNLLELLKASHRYQEDLDLKKGMKVLPLQNLDARASLANGSRGTIVDFETNATSTDEQIYPEEHRSFAKEQIAKFKYKGRNRDIPWPVVKFDNGVQRTIHPHVAIEELDILISRTQFPLVACWAITIHKSQGMTLDKVITKMEKIFAPGQAYVALSRARELSDIQVIDELSGQKMLFDETVKAFMEAKFPREKAT